MTKFLKNLKKDERGLTLIELLAVVVILAIVAAIAFVLIGNVIENSKKDAVISDALQLISSAKLHEAATGEKLEGNEITAADLQKGELLGALMDPWKKTAHEAELTKSKVTKTVTDSVTEYSVTHNGGQGCNISGATEEALLAKDARKDVCIETTP